MQNDSYHTLLLEYHMRSFQTSGSFQSSAKQRTADRDHLKMELADFVSWNVISNLAWTSHISQDYRTQ